MKRILAVATAVFSATMPFRRESEPRDCKSSACVDEVAAPTREQNHEWEDLPVFDVLDGRMTAVGSPALFVPFLTREQALRDLGWSL
ncbi:MAG TPA: hypothetical protein VMB03_31785, partial [Bryobacteraceae bacterium]|nr:hypothetical protein [Bryobacteraceae bacterium]